MDIPLKLIKQFVDDRILARGLRYFEDGSVLGIDETDTGVYEAIVSGSEAYTVTVALRKDTMVAHNCDCPYDMGPICKHIVAVVFYLQRHTLDNALSKNTNSKKKKTMSVLQQVTTLLEKISHKELMAFVVENSKTDKKFRNYFMVSFGHLGSDQSKEGFQKQIRDILQAATGRDGWIDWDGMKYVVNTAQPFLDNAENYLERDVFQPVFFIATALLEEITDAFDYADDSNGDLGYFIEESMELLYTLVHKKIPNQLKTEIFEYCIATFNKKLFQGWDWHLGLLRLATHIVDTESDVDRILSCLDLVDGNYEREYAQSMALELRKKHKTKKEVLDYAVKHIANPTIRSKEIEEAFKKKDYDRVIVLAEDGIATDEKSKPGLVKNWYNWLLKVAQRQMDAPKIVAYARYLLIANFNPEQDYYNILKKTVPESEWHHFLETIIVEVSPKTRWTYNSLIRTIYIKEAWWDRLFALVKQNCSLDTIEQNEIHLSKDYAPEIVQLYRERLLKYVDKYVGRSHYQKACRYLRRMKKLGGGEKVDDLIVFFKEEYPQRKALMDELSRV